MIYGVEFGDLKIPRSFLTDLREKLSHRLRTLSLNRATPLHLLHYFFDLLICKVLDCELCFDKGGILFPLNTPYLLLNFEDVVMVHHAQLKLTVLEVGVQPLFDFILQNLVSVEVLSFYLVFFPQPLPVP